MIPLHPRVSRIKWNYNYMHVCFVQFNLSRFYWMTHIGRSLSTQSIARNNALAIIQVQASSSYLSETNLNGWIWFKEHLSHLQINQLKLGCLRTKAESFHSWFSYVQVRVRLILKQRSKRFEKTLQTEGPDLTILSTWTKYYLKWWAA